MVCYGAITLKSKLKWDDALDVWGVHGVGGIIGTILLGVFATRAVNPAVVTNGLFYGHASFFLTQTVAVIGTAAYAFIFSYGALWLINKITPVGTTVGEEEQGLDESLHGESAYL
jgi:Amt family ammonium transporter